MALRNEDMTDLKVVIAVSSSDVVGVILSRVSDIDSMTVRWDFNERKTRGYIHCEKSDKKVMSWPLSDCLRRDRLYEDMQSVKP